MNLIYEKIMEKIKSQSQFELKINIELTEDEARALKEFTVFGTDAFLKVFYENLGKTTLSRHEKGVISLFETIRKEIPKHLNKADKVRKILIDEINNK